MQLDTILSHYFIKTVSIEVILFGNIIVRKVFEVLLSTQSESAQESSLWSSVIYEKDTMEKTSLDSQHFFFCSAHTEKNW